MIVVIVRACEFFYRPHLEVLFVVSIESHRSKIADDKPRTVCKRCLVSESLIDRALPSIAGLFFVQHRLTSLQLDHDFYSFIAIQSISEKPESDISDLTPDRRTRFRMEVRLRFIAE